MGSTVTGSEHLLDHLGELEDAARRAAVAAGGFVEVPCRIAGLHVRLRFAGPALLASLVRALAHLRVPAGEAPALTVQLFDCESTGIDIPEPPWGWDGYGTHARFHAVVDGRLHGVVEADSFHLYRPETRHGVYGIRSPHDVRPSELGSPLLTILSLWLATRDIQLAHAATVGDTTGCVMIVGPGGAGKSSTALSCLSRDLHIASDDYCLLGPEETPQVHSIYSSAKVDDETLARMPELTTMVANPERDSGEKALIFLDEVAPDRILRRAPLRAIAVARITGEHRTRVSPVHASAALAALAPSTLMQLSGRDASGLARLARAVRAVPCYQLDLGTDAAHIAGTLRSLLDGAA